MRSKIGIGLIVLSLVVVSIPQVWAPADEWVTGFVDEDLFYASYLFEGVDMVYLQGDQMRIIGWYWFEGPILQAGRYIEEAYLEVRTPSIGATDTNATMMIYGKPSGQGGTPSFAEDSNIINGPYTTNSYQVNLSSFVGPGVLHNITVTRILREINQGYYFWDGHDIAFVTIAHDGHDEERSISSLESGYPAKLYIHYGAAPTPPENETGIFIERRNGLDIYQEWGYENFYLDYTETDPQGLLATSESNPYRITFVNFGPDFDNDQDHYFQRDEDIAVTADTIDSRFSCTITLDDNAYTLPDFFWVYQEKGADWIATSHRGTLPNHDFGWITNLGSHGGQATHIDTPIPPPDTVWVRMLYNFTDDSMNISCFESRPTTSWEWENDPDSFEYHDGIHINAARYEDYFVLKNRVAAANGWSNGYLENLVILVDGVPEVNGTFTVIDPEDNSTLQVNLPDLNSTRDWIDIYQAGEGENPEDPNPGDSWGDDPGLLTRFNFKRILFVIGMILFLGTPIYGFATKPEVATWIVIMFCMLSGVALLWALQTM